MHPLYGVNFGQSVSMFPVRCLLVISRNIAHILLFFLCFNYLIFRVIGAGGSILSEVTMLSPNG